MIKVKRAVVVGVSNLMGIRPLATIIVAPPVATSISDNRRPKTSRKFGFSSLKKIFPIKTLLIVK